MKKAIVSAIARNWPFVNGSGRFIDQYAKNLNLGEGRTVARTSDGFPMHVIADDLIGRHILLSGRFDRSIVQVLLDHSSAGDVLLDVGANIGYVSSCFLQNCFESRAVCVEPQPLIIDLLRHNVGQFIDRTDVHNIALSDADGELRFQINNANRGASRIAVDGDIAIRSVDARKFFQALDRVDLMKIDVEGHEAPIFRAAESELARLKPRAIVFEDAGIGAAPDQEIGMILRRLGYEVFGIKKKLRETSFYPIRSAQDCTVNDYLAVI